MKPDLVLYNGVVRTLDPRQPVCSALAIWNHHIVALGDDDLKTTVAHAGQAIDLGGRLALPGFVDGHVHFVEFALRRQRVDLSGVTSLEAALHRVQAAAATIPPGQWILGGGWDHNLWTTAAWPDRQALDTVSRRHPIALDSKDVHTLWVNSLALERAGVDERTPNPAGGKIVRDPISGAVTGILSEMPAKALVWDVIETPPLDEVRRAIRQATQAVWRAGVTGIHDCEDEHAFAAFEELLRNGEAGLRVLMHLSKDNLDAAIQAGVRSGLGDAWLRVGSVKLFMDGALGSRTGHMLEPHLGEPANYGMIVTTREELTDLLARALPNGISAAIHAIGDAANRAALDCLEIAQKRDTARPPLRNRIEHAQILSPIDIPRLAALGVIASVQPLHATADYEMAERYWGEPRIQGAYAYRSLLDAGARLVFGSDCPVEVCDPLGSIYAAATRRRPDGTPGPAGWRPDQRLTVEQALYAQCTSHAYAAGEEVIKGTLTPGKLADLVILSRDIVAEPPEVILETAVHGAIVDGKLVYRSTDWS
jgi:predicted amidohydrolase YtcJ